MKIVKKIFKWILIIAISIPIMLIVGIFLCKLAIYSKSKLTNDISEIRLVKIGGYNQKILLEGKNKEAPLLVILHGGPAVPVPFGAGYRGYYPELTDNYIVVEWDQYGCGNNPADYHNLETKDYVKMTEDLIVYLKNEYPDKELYLLGISWGSFLGAYVVNDVPNLVDKYISYGTLIGMNLAYDYSKEYLLSIDLLPEDRSEIEQMTSYDYNYLLRMQYIGEKYNFDTQGLNKMDNYFYKALLRLLISPDYSFGNISYYFKDNEVKSKLFDAVENDNVMDEVEKISVPTYIIQGKYDNTTPHSVIDELLSIKSNFNYFELESSGHVPTEEDLDKMLNYIVELKNIK